MSKFLDRGKELRASAKDLVLDFMRSEGLCAKDGPGITQAEIFRVCGLDFGDRAGATSTNQQYWVLALLRELEAGGLVERVRDRGPWRLK